MPKHIYFLFFPGYQTLDIMGPIEIMSHLPQTSLHYVSREGGPITSAQGFSINTEVLDALPPQSVLLVPGGMATRQLVHDQAYLQDLAIWAEQSSYCLTVCTGAALIAATGALDGKAATGNKNAFAWHKSVRPQVEWQSRARWVKSGKYYTASGVSAGMDMALGFIAEHYGQTTAEDIANKCEYCWQTDPTDDPFAVS